MPETLTFARMKKYLGLLCIPVLGVGIAVPMTAQRGEPVYRPETYVGPMPIGNLTYREAEGRLKYVWGERAAKPIRLTSKLLPAPIEVTPAQLGIQLDVAATLRDAPMKDFWANWLPSAQPPITLEEVLDFSGVDVSSIVKTVEAKLPKNGKAKVEWVAGRIVKTPEQSGLELRDEAVLEAIQEAVNGEGVAELPITQAEKHVTDAALDSIVGVVAEFSTNFPKNQTSRNTNIRLGSEFLSGTVLMPGDRFSFNEVVGQRTAKRGFKEAGVYVNGRHDTGIGGGICQVSTTLYNAVLLADLKVVKRLNHSMPVAYVPRGRDATVSYNSLDLVFENDSDRPVAVSMEYQSGKLTARILGTPDPSREVKIVTSGHKSWSKGEKVIHDPSLPPGKTVVREKGSAGYSVSSTRIVYRDGKEVRREPLGTSVYGGGVRIVARNTSGTVATPPPAGSESAEPAISETPPTPVATPKPVEPPPATKPIARRSPVRDSAISG